jgi:hypothetical protein
LLNKKASTPSERKYHIVSATLLVFVDASENLVMVDDVATPSNPPISLVKKEELEEAPVDMNFFQALFFTITCAAYVQMARARPFSTFTFQ